MGQRRTQFPTCGQLGLFLYQADPPILDLVKMPRHLAMLTITLRDGWPDVPREAEF